MATVSVRPFKPGDRVIVEYAGTFEAMVVEPTSSTLADETRTTSGTYPTKCCRLHMAALHLDKEVTKALETLLRYAEQDGSFKRSTSLLRERMKRPEE